ncbi:hypothetical protein [Microscilla marina]|uniref:Uncharacterized protein n=1 Tax=Microscilla marina ATCC 23134 TaxID=313606 RepID=A1ZPS6_MICM2|nr:hypothetical protein [Microscilla marina]EAY27581.1 hypothetical protein M23134_02828 [Microscilla marina ATCC 23134]
MDKTINNLVNALWEASFNARCQPVDRLAILPVIKDINGLAKEKRIALIVKASNFYNDKSFFTRLMTCLPELWANIIFKDIVAIIASLKGSVSLMSMVEFFYKYVEIDVFDLALDCEHLPINDRELLISYYAQNFALLFKHERVDQKWYTEKRMGITLEPMILLKETFLKDHRFQEALSDKSMIESYLKLKYKHFKNRFL